MATFQLKKGTDAFDCDLAGSVKAPLGVAF